MENTTAPTATQGFFLLLFAMLFFDTTDSLAVPLGTPNKKNIPVIIFPTPPIATRGGQWHPLFNSSNSNSKPTQIRSFPLIH